jgi:hypothetical protein
LRSVYGANACTGAAFNAKICVDDTLAVFAGSNSADGAFSLARTAADTSFVNDRICHGKHLRFLVIMIIS